MVRSLKANKIPSQIRVSLGSAIALNLLDGKLDAKPTTVYLMTYRDGKCIANCGFCPQANKSEGKAEMLSRVTWPSFPTGEVIGQTAKAAKSKKIVRVCIQSLNYPNFIDDLCSLAKTLKNSTKIPLSVSCQPLNAKNLWSLHKAGVDRIGIALDAATEKIFDKVKGAKTNGPYRWEDEFLLLRTAIGVFGEGNVSTHLMIGLGETEEEAIEILQRTVDMGVLPAIFAFTPIRGTAMALNSQPSIQSYRKIQLARYLIIKEKVRLDNMIFDSAGCLTDFGYPEPFIRKIVKTGLPFLTSGCPGCNRPFYNEKPSGPLYNFPRPLTIEEVNSVETQLLYSKT